MLFPDAVLQEPRSLSSVSFPGHVLSTASKHFHFFYLHHDLEFANRLSQLNFAAILNKILIAQETLGSVVPKHPHLVL